MENYKIIKIKELTYEVNHTAYFADVARCVENGKIYSNEAFVNKYGYGNRYLGNERVSCLCNFENPNEILYISKSQLVGK